MEKRLKRTHREPLFIPCEGETTVKKETKPNSASMQRVQLFRNFSSAGHGVFFNKDGDFFARGYIYP